MKQTITKQVWNSTEYKTIIAIAMRGKAIVTYDKYTSLLNQGLIKKCDKTTKIMTLTENLLTDSAHKIINDLANLDILEYSDINDIASTLLDDPVRNSILAFWLEKHQYVTAIESTKANYFLFSNYREYYCNGQFIKYVPTQKGIDWLEAHSLDILRNPNNTTRVFQLITSFLPKELLYEKATADDLLISQLARRKLSWLSYLKPTPQTNVENILKHFRWNNQLHYALHKITTANKKPITEGVQSKLERLGVVEQLDTTKVRITTPLGGYVLRTLNKQDITKTCDCFKIAKELLSKSYRDTPTFIWLLNNDYITKNTKSADDLGDPWNQKYRRIGLYVPTQKGDLWLKDHILELEKHKDFSSIEVALIPYLSKSRLPQLLVDDRTEVYLAAKRRIASN